MELHEQEEARSLMRETLREELLALRVLTYQAREDFTEGRCDIHLTLSDSSRDGEVLSIDGVGVGLIDAAFQGIKARLLRSAPRWRPSASRHSS